MENKSLEELKKEFAEKITPYKEGVFREFQKRENGYEEPEIVEGLSVSNEETAKRIVALQKEKGFFARKDLVPEDFYKLQSIAKKHGVTIKEAVAMIVKNDKYLSPSEVEIQNICNLMTDIFDVYAKHYETLGVFPVNALSQSSRDYLANKKVALGLADKLGVVFEEYLPEHAGVEIVTKSYKAVPRYRHEFNNEIWKSKLEEIKSKFGDKKGYIDSIFEVSNREYLKELLSIIKERNISFDEFVSAGDLRYTKCVSVASVPSVLQMVKSYKRKVGTFRGITRNDPYLRSKIDLVEEKEKIFKLGELLDHHDIDNDVVDNHQAMDSRDVFLRIVKIGEKLQDMFPDGVIPSNFSTAYPKEYAEVLLISQRLGCESPTVFLEANGFVRNKGGEGRTYSGKMSLSERDLFYYGFIEDELTDEVVKKYDIEPIPVENNIALYRDLIGRRQDSSKKRFEQQKEQ